MSNIEYSHMDDISMDGKVCVVAYELLLSLKPVLMTFHYLFAVKISQSFLRLGEKSCVICGNNYTTVN